MSLWRHSLRSQRRTDHDVQLSLPRLPTRHRERIYSRRLCPSKGIQSHEGIAALLFHVGQHGRPQQTRILSRMRFAPLRWSKRNRPGHRRFQPGRPEFVQTGATHLGFGRTTMGSDGPEAAKIRRVSTAKELMLRDSILSPFQAMFACAIWAKERTDG